MSEICKIILPWSSMIWIRVPSFLLESCNSQHPQEALVWWNAWRSQQYPLWRLFLCKYSSWRKHVTFVEYGLVVRTLEVVSPCFAEHRTGSGAKNAWTQTARSCKYFLDVGDLENVTGVQLAFERLPIHDCARWKCGCWLHEYCQRYQQYQCFTSIVLVNVQEFSRHYFFYHTFFEDRWNPREIFHHFARESHGPGFVIGVS